MLRVWLAGRRERTIGGYWPIKGEFDPLPALFRWSEGGEGRRIGLPVVDRDSGSLRFHVWYPGCPTELDAYDIPKPKGTEVFEPQMLLLPCVGYGPAGARLGYGGGFYDRTVLGLSPRPYTVGLCYSNGFCAAAARGAGRTAGRCSADRRRGRLAAGLTGGTPCGRAFSIPIVPRRLPFACAAGARDDRSGLIETLEALLHAQSPADLGRQRRLVHGVEVQRRRAAGDQALAQRGHDIEAERAHRRGVVHVAFHLQRDPARDLDAVALRELRDLGVVVERHDARAQPAPSAPSRRDASTKWK